MKLGSSCKANILNKSKHILTHQQFLIRHAINISKRYYSSLCHFVIEGIAGLSDDRTLITIDVDMLPLGDLALRLLVACHLHLFLFFQKMPDLPCTIQGMLI